MINFPIKALIGVGAAGAVGLGGYGIYSVASKSSSKTIADILKEEGKELLSFDNTNDDAAWDSKVSKFSSTGSDVHKLGDFQKSENQDENNRNAMKKECKQLSSIIFDSSKEEIKEQVKTWCTKDNPSS